MADGQFAKRSLEDLVEEGKAGLATAIRATSDIGEMFQGTEHSEAIGEIQKLLAGAHLKATRLAKSYGGSIAAKSGST